MVEVIFACKDPARQGAKKGTPKSPVREILVCLLLTGLEPVRDGYPQATCEP